MALNTRTLLQLRTAVQRRGQYENSSDIDSAMLNDFINEAIAELYDMLLAKDAEYYTVIGSPFSLVANTESYVLDTVAPGFYKLRKVEILMSGTAGQASARWQRLFPHALEASHNYSQYGLVAKGYRYRLEGANLAFAPIPASGDTTRVFYIPYPAALSADGDLFNFHNSYEELVVQLALLRCKRREELPTEDIEKEVARLAQRISAAADARDQAEPFYLDPHGPGGGDEDPEWW